MLSKVKNVFKHSVIYGLSNAATKASGIILLPIHTEFFTTDDYGLLSIMLFIALLLSQTMVLGQNMALLRFSNSEEYRPKRDSLFFTVSLFVFAVAALIGVVGYFGLEFFASLSERPELYTKYLLPTFVLSSLLLMNSIFLNKLRADESSFLYFLAGLAKLSMIIAFTFYFVVHLGYNIEGVLYANIAGEIFSMFVMIPVVLKRMKFRFEGALFKESLKYGLPLIFSVIALYFLVGVDRVILQILTNDGVVGLYELGYKVAGIINMFIIMPFNLVLFPVAFNLYKKENDLYYYSKIMTYSIFIIGWATLVVALFGKEIILIFAKSESFYAAETVVPYLVFSYIFVAMGMVAALGMYITGKTKAVAVINGCVALLNIGLNYLLIPYWGMEGAAVATIFSYIVFYFVSLHFSKKYYNFTFEYTKIYSLVLLTVGLFFAGYLPDFGNLFLNGAYKLLVGLSFPVFIFFSGYLTKHERNSAMKLINGLRNPAELKNMIRKIKSGNFDL